MYEALRGMSRTKCSESIESIGRMDTEDKKSKKSYRLREIDRDR